MSFPSEFIVLEDLSKFNRYTKSKRFESLHIQTEKGQFYYKKALAEKEVLALNNEVAFANFINEADVTLRAPTVVHAEEGLAVFEWIEADLLAPSGRKQKLAKDQIDAAVEVLLAIDSLNNQTYEGSSPYARSPSEYVTRVVEWSDRIIAAGLATPQEITRATDLITLHLPHITSRLQHGDLMLDHVFTTEPLTIYDGEHASCELPRFDDFARLYTRAFITTEDKSSVRQIAAELAEKVGLSSDEFWKEARAPTVYKAVAALNDALNDKQEFDYTSDARQLFAETIG